MANIKSHISRMRQHSDHQAIGRALISITLFVLLGKLIGAAKEVAVAWRYGTGIEVDSYLFIFNILGWPISVFYGTIYAALIPIATRIKTFAPAELPQIRSELLGATLLASTGTTLIIAPIIYAGIEAGIFGLTPNQRSAALVILLPMCLIVPLGWLTALWSTWALFSGRQISTFFEAIPALVILVAVLLSESNYALVLGTTAGFGVWAALLLTHLIRHREFEGPKFTKKHGAWPELRSAIYTVFIAQLFSSAAGVADQFFAARLGEGALSTLGYASRLLALVLGLGATAIGRAVLPIFSNAYARGDASLNSLAKYWCKLMLGIGTIFMLLGMALATNSVSLLFERGAFTASDTHSVATLLKIGLLQIPFAIANIVATYALHSQGMQAMVTKIAIAGFFLKVVLNACLTPTLGSSGLFISTTVVMATMYVLTYRQLKASK